MEGSGVCSQGCSLGNRRMRVALGLEEDGGPLLGGGLGPEGGSH